ncbi:MAG: exosortase/archaeosortase family protein, partial [Rariglobus sp.]
VGPLALLFTAIPWPSTVENLFLHPLRQALAMGVAEMLNLMSVPAFSEGATIRISGGVVGVDEACGGMRSLQTALMIGWFVGELGRMPLTRRLGLLMSAALAAIGGNFLRALVLTWLMDVGGVDLLNKWHDPAGYLALGSTLIVVVLLGWLWRSKAPAVIGAAVMAVRFPRSAIVWVLCSLAACVVTEFGVRAWYGSREQTNGQALAWTVRWPDKAKNFRKFPLADSAREMLRPDDFSSAAWRTPEDRERSGYYIVWESGQLARNAPFVHTPEICLPLTGIELIGRDNPEIANVGGVSIPFEVYRFQQHGQPMYVFRVVWNPDELRAASAPRKTDNRGKWLGERWADVRARRVAVRAQVLTLALSGEKSREDALRAFHEELALIVRTDAREK